VKLTLTVVRNEDADAVVEALITNGFYVTRLPSTGGFLRAGNTVLLTGLEDDRLDEMVETVKGRTRLRVQPPTSSAEEEVTVSRAVVFVLGLEELRKL
jgi:uncharacterized protein YaaQ